jgi:hypothetical protein
MYRSFDDVPDYRQVGKKVKVLKNRSDLSAQQVHALSIL